MPVGTTVDDTEFGLTGESVWAFAGELPRLTVRPSTSRHDDFTFTVQTTKAKWHGDSFDNSPHLYHLQHSDNAIPRTPRWHDRRRDLARVRSEHASTTPGSTGIRDRVAVPLPGTLTEYYTPDVPWAFRTFAEVVDDEVISYLTQYQPMVFPRGRTTTVRWNVGVARGAVLTGPRQPQRGTRRQTVHAPGVGTAQRQRRPHTVDSHSQPPGRRGVRLAALSSQRPRRRRATPDHHPRLRPE